MTSLFAYYSCEDINNAETDQNIVYSKMICLCLTFVIIKKSRDIFLYLKFGQCGGTPTYLRRIQGRNKADTGKTLPCVWLTAITCFDIFLLENTSFCLANGYELFRPFFTESISL